MNHIDTVFESSSRDIFNLTKNFINADFEEKLLDTFMVQNHKKKSKKRKENARFRTHPNLLTSSDSDVSGKTTTLRNGYRKHELVLYNSNDQISDVALKENTLYLFTPRHAESSPERSSLEVQDFLNSSIVDFMRKNDTYSNDNVKLNAHVKDDIVTKPEECQTNNMGVRQNDMDKKLLHFLQKTLSCLEDISLSMSTKIILPDGQEDWLKRRVRGVEFSSRFHRNYLYPFGRQILELENVIKNSYYNHSTKSVSQCVLTAHQTLLQGLQAYHNYIPICLGNVGLDKFKIAIDYAVNLLSVHLQLLSAEDCNDCVKKNLIESILEKCKTVLDKATQIMAEPIEPVPPKKAIIKSCRSTNKLLFKNNVRKRIDSKLSMYSIPCIVRKRDVWKRSVDVRCNDKFRNVVQSRYKTAGFKHRPPVEKIQISDVPTKNKLFPKKSLAYIKNTPLTTPKNEDTIKTMISTIKEEEEKGQYNNDTEFPVVPALESVMPLLKSICSNIISNNNNVVNHGQVKSVLQNLLDMTLHGTIDKEVVNNNFTLNGVQKNGFKHAEEGVKNLSYKSSPNLLYKVDSRVANRKVQVKNGKRHFESSTVELNLPNTAFEQNVEQDIKINVRSNKWQTVSVTGKRNAQLICIRDDSSTPEISLLQPNPSLETIAREATFDEIDTEGDDETTKKNLHIVKISRLPKSTLRSLTSIPKVEIKSIVQGKLRHAKYMKGNQMYCKTSQRHPWQIVDHIAESLLNEILLSIAQEIQVNNILESLYNSEFQ